MSNRPAPHPLRLARLGALARLRRPGRGGRRARPPARRTGQRVDVLTTTIVDLHRVRRARSSIGVVDGATVHYLATPLRYRWMGITPTLPLALARAHRPDVVHVFGFRDPVTTGIAAWCRIARVPYVFEPLGMFEPRLRKVAAQACARRDALPRCRARRCCGRRRLRARGQRRHRVRRGSREGACSRQRLPRSAPFGSNGDLRAQLDIPDTAPLILYVGRIAAGKGIEHLLGAAREIPEAHVVVAGPDDRHGVGEALRRAQSDTRRAAGSTPCR